MKVIAISGKARHGKDTTAEIIKEELEARGDSVLIAHYGDLPKYICKTFFGWNGVKDDYGRSLLQYIGTDVVRKQEPDFWVNFILDILRLFSNEWEWVLIPDTRFPNEVEGLKESGFDTIHLRIERRNFESPLTQEQQAHPSETALDGYAYDKLIINDGTLEELRKKIKTYVKENLANE